MTSARGFWGVPGVLILAQSALMAHAAAKTPTVATTGLAVDVRACFNSRSPIVLLTTGLTQAVRKMGPGDLGQWVVNPGAIYLSRSTSGSTVGVLRVEKGRKSSNIPSSKPYSSLVNSCRVCTITRPHLVVASPVSSTLSK
ncbi:hypothetical protein SCLCIDRAFT_979431 [Scleroderma citrinum Foug A]|uniref:Secreted protein n=1 Tax=Scleroderma citrinum Foug A TaxID=1036808 RepID=A0A0C3DGU3_9AGAM|nr:hypothetical protein SCLCIDRAFT_979431 [Scleroderma citrinum Foug A]